MIEELKSTFSLAICFALAGSLLGSMFIVTEQNKGNRTVTFLVIVLSMVISTALADYMFEPNPWQYAGTGIVTGMASSALLDAFKAAAPQLASRIINAIGNIAVAFVEKSGKKEKE